MIKLATLAKRVAGDTFSNSSHWYPRNTGVCSVTRPIGSAMAKYGFSPWEKSICSSKKEHD